MEAETSRPQQSTLAGRWFLAAIGLFLALLGGAFVFLMARSFGHAWQQRHWPEVPCMIMASTVNERRHDEQSGNEFQQSVTFGYTWKNQAYISQMIGVRGSPWSSDRKEIEKRVAELPVGKAMTCRVDPLHPSFAILKPDSLAPGYSIWFPGLFVVAGLMMAKRALLPKAASKR